MQTKKWKERKIFGDFSDELTSVEVGAQWCEHANTGAEQTLVQRGRRADNQELFLSTKMEISGPIVVASGSSPSSPIVVKVLEILLVVGGE